MREIATHVDINAEAALVWDILTDFATYQRWNPLVRSVLGAARRGDTIVITERHGHRGTARKPGRSATMRRIVKHIREPLELHWLGRWGLDSIYATERRFRIESLRAGGVRFHQSEQFRGVAVPFLWSGLRRDLIPGFHAMNRALKARAERAEAENVASRARPGGARN